MNKKTNSLRERKKRRTRESLIDAASQLFQNQGFENTTVDQIVARAEFSPRTFFRYFPSKEAVVFAKHPERVAGFRDLLQKLGNSSDPPLRVVRRALIEMARIYQDQKEELLREYGIVTSSPILTARDMELDHEFEKAIADAIVQGSEPGPEAERRAAVMASAVFGAVRATMEAWFSSRCTLDLVALAKEGFKVLIEGIGELRTESLVG